MVLKKLGTTMLDAYNKITDYNVKIANLINSKENSDGLPRRFYLSLEQVKSLKPEERARGEPLKFKYAENPGKRGIAWKYVGYSGGVCDFEQLSGPNPSWNNYREVSLSFDLIEGFESIPTTMITKHGKMVGLACSKTAEDAYRRAHETDIQANLGNQTIINMPCTEKLAKMIGKDLKNKWTEDISDMTGGVDSKHWTVFTEGLIAPKYKGNSLEILNEKQIKKMRTYKYNQRSNFPYNIKPLAGGNLAQEGSERKLTDFLEGEWLTEKKGDKKIEKKLSYLGFVVSKVDSNGITVGNVELDEHGELEVLEIYGFGSENKRNLAVKNALERNLLDNNFETDIFKRNQWALLASDGFFPYYKVLNMIHRHGIEYIIIPRGGRNMGEVIETADVYGIGMYFINERLFCHS